MSGRGAIEKLTQAHEFYEYFGFEPSPSDPLHLMLVMKDLKARTRS